MLILTRRVSETLIIGSEEVTVTVLGVKGNQVRIGIDAPKDVQVHRKEIWQRIQDEKKKPLNIGIDMAKPGSDKSVRFVLTEAGSAALDNGNEVQS